MPVFKRSTVAGFRGVRTSLFYNPQTKMLFGDAKTPIEPLIKSVKEL